jgi:arginase
MHGMPLGFLLGLVDNVKNYPSMNWFDPCVNPKDVCYIGLRDLDSEEKKIVRKLGIKAFTVSIPVF